MQTLIRQITGIFAFLCLIQAAAPAAAAILTADTVWEGNVSVTEDVLVPEGVTLTIKPGTVITITPSDSSKTDPEYLSSMTEITVRGSLLIEGNPEAPVSFRKDASAGRDGNWAGIFVDGGRASLTSCRIEGAENGIYVINGALNAADSVLTRNRYGLIAEGPGTKINIRNVRITGNEYGFFVFNNAEIVKESVVIEKNNKKDRFAATAKKYPFEGEYRAGRQETTRHYGDEILLQDTIWRGKIEIHGIVRVPEATRLVILPGTVVEVTRRDTNGDGIGENGLLIQGLIIAKGTKDEPIVFRSAEKKRRAGDWDGINIMNSDGARNLIEYCQIEDSYRAVHFHFANLALVGCVLKHNYRAIQFQESTAQIARNIIAGNKSGIQARDSEIEFTDNVVADNFSGANFFRCAIQIRRNTITGNGKEGLRIREGFPAAAANVIDGNRNGCLLLDAQYGIFERNVVTHNLESGIAVRNTDAVRIAGNYIQENGLNGAAVHDSGAVIENNVITRNGERGIAVADFDGIITGNTIIENVLYAIGTEGRTDVAAPGNWLGNKNSEDVIYDGGDDPARGRVRYSPPAWRPIAFAWPLPIVPVDMTWYGDIRIDGRITVPSGRVLTVAPTARVLFGPDAGIESRGMIRARGEPNGRILFTSADGKPWNEITLDHATGSLFAFCDFDHATWAIHSHFTDLSVSDCSFRSNYGGIRFQSGPLRIQTSLFEKNTIGIRSFRGSALISGNCFAGNETGIFVREKGSGLTIRNNNIVGNAGYGIRSGDFNNEDIDAAENWWGPDDPLNSIFDGGKESGIGMVRYQPAGKKPYPAPGIN